MYLNVDKLMHFAVGLGIGAAFWWLGERYTRAAMQRLNPIVFLIMVIWGASGLFFFRWLHLPVLSGQFFYMAVPDWDIPLYLWSRAPWLIHRSWLFHSVLLPMGLLALSWWGLHSTRSNQQAWKWLYDGAIALSVGMSAHLFWDALLSSSKRGFYIHGWSLGSSYLWLAANLLVGLAVPLGLLSAMGSSNQTHDNSSPRG